MEDLFTNMGQRFEEAGKSFTGTWEKLTMRYGLKTLEDQQREVLAERKSVLGAEHPDTLLAADHLSRTLADQGKGAEAEEMEREAPSAKKSSLPSSLPRSLPIPALATHNGTDPAKVFTSIGRSLEEAGKSLEKIAKETGDAVGDSGKSLEKLAMDYGLKTLEEQQRKGLAERKSVLGAEHPGTLSAADNLARTLADQGKCAEAEEMQREVLAVRKRVEDMKGYSTFGSNSSKDIEQLMVAGIVGDSGKSLEKLAMDYGLKTLEEQQRKGLAERKSVLGAEHPGTLSAADNLARTLADQGKCAEAEEMQREVLAVRKRVEDMKGYSTFGSNSSKDIEQLMVAGTETSIPGLPTTRIDGVGVLVST